MAKILIIDDSVDNRELVATVVGYDGHEALEAGDGAEALAVARRELPDLIVCDILMPTMDGYEFVRVLRGDERIAGIEVIFYTANYHEREARQLAAKLGVTQIITKPCLPEDIIAAIDCALSNDRSPPPMIEDESFDREHQRLLTDKLSSKVRELEYANQRLAELTELNLKLSTERDLHAAMDQACRGARLLLGARYAIICIEAPSGNDRRPALWRSGFAPATPEDSPYATGSSSLFADVMASKQTTRFRNPGGSPDSIGLPANFPQSRSCVVSPISTALSVLGWVCLLDKIGAIEFTPEDEWLASTIATQAGHIYDNSALCAQLERRALELESEVRSRTRVEAQLRRALRARRMMAECNRTLVRATDEGDLLRDMCTLIVRHGDYRRAWTGLVDDTDGPIRIAASAGDESCAVLDELVRITLQSSLPQVERASDSAGSHAPEHPVTGLATAAIPLVADDEPLGVLCITSAEQNAFDDEDIALLLELADDIAYGVHTLRARALRRRAEDSLRLRERAIEASVNAIVISRADLADDNPVIYANPGFETMTGYTAAEFAGRNLRTLLGDDWDQPGIERLRNAIRNGHDTHVTLRNYRKDGSLFWSEITLAPVRDASGQVTHFVSIFNDCTENKRYQAELERQANHDALTGLANRNLLFDRLQQAMMGAERARSKMAVMLLDLDRFKRINDGLSHADGDLLLQEVARRLERTVRRDDTVARLGGDEFVVVMSSLVSEHDAMTLARKILDTISSGVVLSGRKMFVTASLGISIYPRDGDDPVTLIKNADQAMYRAKELGRQTFQFYAPELNVRTLERLELETQLQHALERNEFELYFQPKVAFDTGRVSGAEALIRWNHPERGLLAPGAFIPLAEETGLIVPIGAWVVETACRALGRLQAKGRTDISIAINVSARQFTNETLPELLATALASHAVDATRLHVEVTESAVMDDPDRTIRILHSLKRLGVSISLDDFGTGYSSLTYLKRFPLDSIKIDRSFTEDISGTAESAALPLMIVSLGHRLGHKVIAEGVETMEQASILADHLCDEMQGFLFSKPLPAVEFENLLDAGTRLKLD